MPKVKAYAAQSPSSRLAPHPLERRDPGDKDVVIAITHCGICHTDIHQARNEWGGSVYPVVPGHEIVGRVVRAGRKVKRLKAGDAVGVGCMVDSCRTCANCRKGLEQHCLKGASFTYNSTEQDKETRTHGGYSQQVVVDQDFVLKVPSKLPLERVAPLLCAGITTYSPLKRWKVGKGSRVGVMGLGGLGHMAVKLAAAMGAQVTVLSRSRAKEADARRLGAKDFALTSAPGTAERLAGRFDLILDTISAEHELDSPLACLATGGTLVLLGVPPKPFSVPAFALVGGRKNLSGSVIGGIAETQEMLDFCAKKGTLADVEVIPFSSVNEAFERTIRGDVRYRFVLDAKTL